MDRITKTILIIALPLLAPACTWITIDKHADGSASIRGASLLQDIKIPEMSFAATRPTTQPGVMANEQFKMTGFGQQARTELLSKMLDKLPAVP